MKTSTDQLKFIVSFATADLDAYRPGDWQNLQDDFELLLYGPKSARWDGGYEIRPGGESAVLTSGDMPEVDKPKLVELQRRVLIMIERCVERAPGEQYSLEGSALDGSLMFDVSVSIRKGIGVDPASGRAYGVLWGTFEDLVIDWTYQLLIRNPLRPVRRCPVCKTVFFRVKKQEYCGRKCFLKAYHKNKSEAKRATKKAVDRKSAKKRRLDKAKAR